MDNKVQLAGPIMVLKSTLQQHNITTDYISINICPQHQKQIVLQLRNGKEPLKLVKFMNFTVHTAVERNCLLCQS